MKLYIVRHGETISNASGITQGHKNSKLSKQGEKQAELLANRLKNVKFDYIYSSDLLRAKQTTKSILKNRNCPVKYVKALRERNMGMFSGRPMHEYREYIEKNNLYGKIHKRIPNGGESIYSLQKRIIDFSEKIYKKHKNDTVLFSTHGGIKKFFLMHLNGIKLNDWKNYTVRFENTSLSVIKFHENKKHEIILENCTDHLK